MDRRRRLPAAGRHLAAATIATTALLGGGDMIEVAEGHHDAYRRISTGQINGNGEFLANFRATTPDGNHVFFTTAEQLVAADTDSESDVYDRHGGTTTLVSAGAINGNGAFSAFFAGAANNGARVFFMTSEQLVSGDTDAETDVYQRFNGATTRISAGKTNGNGAFSADYEGSSADGTIVFFSTDEKLVSGDTDSVRDLYQRSGTKTKLLSGGGTNAAATFEFASANGSIVIFTSNQRITSDDTDDNDDTFMRQGTTTTRISKGSINGNGDFEAEFNGATPDGSKIYFETEEKLVSGDTDDDSDVYVRANGDTKLLVPGAGYTNFEGVSSDGSKAFFLTDDQLAATDTDNEDDVYMRSGTTTTHVSRGQINGNGAHSVNFAFASADGTHVFFGTNESLVSADTDGVWDYYERFNGVTTLVTVGDINGNTANEPTLYGISTDGTRAFFTTAAALVTDDGDAVDDVYERAGGQTYVLSLGDANSLSVFNGLSADGTAVFYGTDEKVLLNDKDTAIDIYGIYDR